MVYTMSRVHECCANLTFHRSPNSQILVWNNHWDFWCGLGLVLGLFVGLGNLVREHEMTFHYLAICIGYQLGIFGLVLGLGFCSWEITKSINWCHA